MSNIKIIFIDIDGTLTDGKIYFGNNGEIMKAFNVKDGYAIHELLPKNGIIPIVITGRESKIVHKRCEELGIYHVYQNCSNKRQKILDIAKKMHMQINEEGVIKHTAYIGDDILDIPGMNICEVTGCPADACEKVKKIVSYVCINKAGNGAVREFIEFLVSAT